MNSCTPLFPRYSNSSGLRSMSLDPWRSAVQLCSSQLRCDIYSMIMGQIQLSFDSYLSTYLSIYEYLYICVFVNWNWAYQIQKWLKIVPFSLSPFLDRHHDKVSIDPDGWDIQTIPNQGAVNIMLPKLKMFRSCGCASGDTSAASTPRSAPTREPKICTSMAIQRTWENRGTRDVHHE